MKLLKIAAADTKSDLLRVNFFASIFLKKAWNTKIVSLSDEQLVYVDQMLNRGEIDFFVQGIKMKSAGLSENLVFRVMECTQLSLHQLVSINASSDQTIIVSNAEKRKLLAEMLKEKSIKSFDELQELPSQGIFALSQIDIEELELEQYTLGRLVEGSDELPFYSGLTIIKYNSLKHEEMLNDLEPEFNAIHYQEWKDQNEFSRYVNCLFKQIEKIKSEEA